MKRELRGLKRRDIQFDFDLYRVSVPISGVAGSTLSVVDLWPEGAEQTILFVHGFAGCLETWEFQINYFARHNFRVIAPDLRGHGHSDAPFTEYTMDELVCDLQTIVETLAVTDKFVLVGHSFGGSICTEYAIAHPERLAKLVLIATAGEFPLPRLTNLLLRVPLPLIRPLWKYRPRWNSELHVFKRMMANNLRQWRGWPLFSQIQTPTLVVTGERDFYFPRYVYANVGQAIPGAEVVDVGTAKHKVQLERHEAVNRVIERFVKESHRSSWRDTLDDASPFPDRIWLKHYEPGIPPTIPIPHRPLTSFLDSAAEAVPQRTALIFYGADVSYKQLQSQVHQFAHVLHGLGVRPGDRVMIVLPNIPQLVVAYYATLRIGGVVVLPNPDADAAHIAEQAQQTGTKVFITLRDFAHLAHIVHERAGVPKIIFTEIRHVVSMRTYRQLAARWHIDPDAADPAEQASKLGDAMADLMWDAPTHAPDVLVHSDQLAVIVFTSGTTDEPKGVCLTHHNLVANTLQTRHWVKDLQHGHEVFLSVVPLLHSYGMTSAMNVPIALAATIVLLPVFEVEQVLSHIQQYRPTIFPGVPTMYMAINAAPHVRNYGLSSIKGCISGAAPLPIEIQEAFEKLTHGKLIEGYGLTEASPITHASPFNSLRKAGSIGIPLPNTEARIVDLLTGVPVSVGQIGELQVRGPQVMRGYWQLDSLPDRSAIVDGWLATGDVAVCDGDGFFTIISRKRDTIMAGEYSVFPRDVEEVLYENSKVMEVAVVGVEAPSSNGQAPGHKVKAFVVPRPGTTLTADELIALCQKRLEPYAVPWEIEFRTELPKSFIGKVLRRMLVTKR